MCRRRVVASGGQRVVCVSLFVCSAADWAPAPAGRVMNNWNAVHAAFATLAAAALFFTVQQCAGYKCYVCSWSPASPNRTDTCTFENFNKDMTKVFDGCPYGCGIAAAYDSNEKLENFYRNCVVKGKEVTNDCRDETTVAFRNHFCRCNSDLCNSAAAVSSPVLLCTLAAAAVTISSAVR